MSAAAPPNSPASPSLPGQPAAGISRQIDALRGTAALLVFLHHLQVFSDWRVPYLGDVGGFLGVQLFFLISGYLIIQSAGRYPLGTYLRHRFFRIVPCYWVVSLPLFFFYGKLPVATLWPEAGYVLASLLMVGLWVPTALQHYDMVRVSWTLSIELAWYATALAMARWLPLQRAACWAWLLPLALVLSGTWTLLSLHGHLDAAFAALYGMPLPLDAHTRNTFLVGNFPGLFLFFVVGAALWRFGPALARLPVWALAATVAAFVLPAWWWMRLQGTVSPTYALGLAALFVWALRARGRWLEPLRLLGVVSYPVYLLHVPVLLFVYYHGKLSGPAGLGLAVGATLLLAAGLHYAVEKPFMRLGRRSFSGAPAGRENA